MKCEFCGKLNYNGEIANYFHKMVGTINSCAPCMRHFDSVTQDILEDAQRQCINSFERMRYKEPENAEDKKDN